MSMRYKEHKLYKLEGQSLKAAQALLSFFMEERQSPAHKNINDLMATIERRILATDPAILDTLGLKQPSATVDENCGFWPRAYLKYPKTYITAHDEPQFYMFCPIDHYGNHFVPADGQGLTADYSGVFLEYGPLFAIRDEGITVPVDYKQRDISLSLEYLKSTVINPPHLHFLAAGKSLDLLREQALRKIAFDHATGRLIAAVREIVESMYPLMLENLPAGESLYINTMNDIDRLPGKPFRLEMSVHIEGRIKAIDGGRAVAIPLNPCFKVDEDDVISPRFDTEEGREIRELFDGIPMNVGINREPELMAFVTSPSGPGTIDVAEHIPARLNIFSGFNFLTYRKPSKNVDVSGFHPPDALPVSAALYKWMRQDHDDEIRKIKPPPMPYPLQQEMTALMGTLNRISLEKDHGNLKPAPSPA